MLRNRKIEIIVGPKGARGKSIGNLDVDAKMTKSSDSSTPNRCELTVYNMSDETRRLLSGPNIGCIVRAGYDEMVDLFTGDVQYSSSIVSGADSETHIRVIDGFLNWRDRRCSISFRPGTSKTDVLRALINEMGLPYGPVKNLPGSFTTGFAFHGPVRDGLNLVLGRTGWSVQDGKLITDPTRNRQFTISSESGMIGSPEVQRIESKSGKTVTELHVSCLLNGSILVGDTIRLQTRFLTGTSVVKSVTHRLADDWTTDIIGTWTR